jgi:mycothiol synthase
MDININPENISKASLTFNHYQGEQDLPAMLDVFRSSQVADGEDAYETLEDFTDSYSHLTNCDPYRDVLVVEVNQQVVAYEQVSWLVIDGSGERIYLLIWYTWPEWRGQGLEKLFLQNQQERLRQIICQQDHEAPFSGIRLFETQVSTSQTETIRLLEENGFRAIRWGSKLTCSNLNNIPEAPLPPGLKIRPIRPEHYRFIWDAMWEAFQDHWGVTKPDEEQFYVWQNKSIFQPHLWQIAWDGDQVAGLALNCIAHDPANTAEPVSAWTENLCVRRPWRRRGLARALLARSMRMFCEMGCSQASVGVDRNNLHGARQLYVSMGYELISVLAIYRKPVYQNSCS